ncbi:MAG: sugar ABC transporter permease [Alicyclobacillus sp.]|nr:sugar ABC transporter permease [Alicyclobacillus sp.]
MHVLRTAKYPFLLPALVLMGLVYLFPLGVLFNTSFHAISGYFSQWVGLTNYALVLKDDLFGTAVIHNVILLFVCVPAILVLAVLLSVFLMEEIPGWRFFRTVVFLPYILSIPVVAVVFDYLLQYDGPVNAVLRRAGLGSLAQDWLGSPHWALGTLMAIIIWKELGFGVILFYARLVTIPKEILEAGELDGAGWWKRLWHVILPQLRGVMEFYTVVEGITMLSWVFSYVYIISQGTGGPGTSTMVTELYVYQNAFGLGSASVGLASAAATILFVGSLLIILVTLRFQRGEVE